MKTEVLNWFREEFPELVNDLKECNHYHSNGNPNPYHMEDDCWTHTLMVYDNVNDNNLVLLFGALLHDIGKTRTRKEKVSGRVAFRYHENVSTILAIEVLQKAKTHFNLSNGDIITTLRLIAWHGELWNKGNETEHLQFVNQKFGFDQEFYETFVSAVEADALGREMSDELMLETMEKMDFFKNYIPYNASEFKRHNPKNEVIFMVGLSGSGKSTFIDRMKEDYRIISFDDNLASGKLDYNSVSYSKNSGKAYKQVLRDIDEAVKKEENVIIDMTNLSVESRRRRLKLFPSTKYKKKAQVILTSLPNILDNLKQRDKKIPREVIDRQIFSFEFPGLNEFDEVEVLLY